MISLVSYDASSSSDDESENDENINSGTEVITNGKDKSLTTLPRPAANAVTVTATATATLDSQISDDDDENYEHEELSLQEHKRSFTLSLPKPKNPSIDEAIIATANAVEHVTPRFTALPTPKQINNVTDIVEEKDDEFLHKKATPISMSGADRPQLPPTPVAAKVPVKITIPSLKEFKDIGKNSTTQKAQTISPIQRKINAGCGLLSILPQAKSERVFTKSGINENADATATASATAVDAAKPKVPMFIPDTVKNRRPARNTEGIDGVQIVVGKNKAQLAMAKHRSASTAIVERKGHDDDDDDVGDDDDNNNSDNDSMDFFSLNAEVKLPDVSSNEILAMVAKRSANMSQIAMKFSNSSQTEQIPGPLTENEATAMDLASKGPPIEHLNDEAVQALVGSGAKRRRRGHCHGHREISDSIQVVDLSSDQVLPDREEWLRTALASSTSYQPTGVLADEEPATGTRRKHQITYLAHKAKINEAELQAMWAANRQNRRATQSKYGF